MYQATNTYQNGKRKKQNLAESIISDLSAISISRPLPNAEDIERVVLGIILLDGNMAFDIASGIVKPHFFSSTHEIIFNALLRLSNAHKPIGILTAQEELKKTDELETVGGKEYVRKLTSEVASSSNLEPYCVIIQQYWMQRQLITATAETHLRAYQSGIDVLQLMDDHESLLSAINNQTMRGNYQDSASLVIKAIERVDFLRANKGALTGVPSGFRPLDNLTNGWQPTDLIILAARPSVGKTAFAINLARNATINHQKQTAVGFFSLEMSAGQLIQRVIACESRIDLTRITNGRVDEIDYNRFIKASERVGDYKLFIDDTAALNIMEFRAKARQMVRKHKVGFIIIDYLQLMSGVDERNTNREQQLSEVSRNLKAIAKELDIPIIALSQLSREIEKRKPAIPQLSDLRECGAIEQDADLVMFLTRPTYQKDANEIDPMVENDIKAWIKKHRNGPLDNIPLKIDLSIQKVFDLAQYDECQLLNKNMLPMREFNNYIEPDKDEGLPF